MGKYKSTMNKYRERYKEEWAKLSEVVNSK